MPEQEIVPATTEEVDGSTQDVSNDMDTAFSEPTEGTTEIQPTSEPPVFDWSQYQNASHLTGRPVQEVINHYSQREYQYGQQANELGELRRQAAELQKLRQQINGQPQKKEPKEFSELEQQMFIRDFNENPMLAATKHLTPQMAEELLPQLTQKISESLRPQWEQQVHAVQDEQEKYAFFQKNGEEIEKDPRLLDTTKLIMSQYLGDDVPYEEAYQLGKMVRDEQHLFKDTYSLMRKQIPFKAARDFALARHTQSQNAETKIDTIKGEVNRIKFGSKKSAIKQVTSEPEVLDWDDAFAPD